MSRMTPLLEPLEPRRLFALTGLWTFNDGTPNDSVGGNHAVLFNGASISNGRLFLQNAGVTSGQSTVVQYAQLPAGVIPDSGSVSINVWYNSFSAVPQWMRVFDFGTKNGTGGRNYLFFSPLSNSSDARAVIRPGSVASADVTATTARANQGYQRMATVVVDATVGQYSLYLDGLLASTVPLGGVTLADVQDSLNFLGRSLWDSDAGFSGTIEELQIYNEALPAGTISGLMTAGASRPAPVSTPRRMENLGRGLTANYRGSGNVYLSWRTLGTDPASVGFNVYRQIGNGSFVKRNASPITASSDYTDTGIDTTQVTRYYVRPVVGGVEQAASATTVLGASPVVQDYVTVPLNKPAGGVDRTGDDYFYVAGDGSVADLDGDGEYEIIQKWWTEGSTFPGPEMIDAYKMDGTHLWRINLGTNTNVEGDFFIAYDLDGDGKAEIVARTADGTTSGTGQVIGNPNADWMNGVGVYQEGWTVNGPEWLTVFSGIDGSIRTSIPFQPARGSISDWGDNYGQRSRQTKGVVAYLNGTTPSIVITRGIYYGWSGYSAKTEMAAYDFSGTALTQRWFFRAAVNAHNNINSNFVGQGNHNMSVADVDFDGKDELVFGAMVVDDDGRPLASSQMEHGDALHVSDLNPSRPGLEVFGIHENEGTFDPLRPPGAASYDPLTGRMIWGQGNGLDVGRGVSADIDPNVPGMENWSIGGPAGVRDASGNVINANTPSSVNFTVWWDGDLSRELLDRTYVEKWNPATGTLSRVFTADSVGANQSTKQFPVLSADVFGDWREEIVWRLGDSTALRIYNTSAPSAVKQYTLMHDSQYRVAVAWQNQGYNQPPHPSFFLGTGMAAAPTPNITLATAADPVPAAPNGLTATILNNGGDVALTWNAVPGATYRVKRSADPGGPYLTIANNLTSAAYTDAAAAPGGTYYYTVTAVSPLIRESAASNEVVATSAFPWPWTVRDIGTLPGEGRSSLENGIFSVRSFSVASSATTDGLRMISQDLPGDHTLTVRVDGKNNRTGAAGLMFRASTAANAAFVSVSAEPTDNDRLFMRWRNSTGASSTWTVAYSGLPVWLRLQRAGNNFTGSWSPDGVTWTAINTRAVTMNTTVPAGLYVQGSSNASTTVAFSNVSVVNPANTAPTATFQVPATVNEGSPGSLTLANATDSSADLTAGLRYSFDFDNDGTFEVVNAATNSAVVPAAYFPDGPASRIVRGVVMDRYGATTSYTGTVTVANVTPVVGTITAPAIVTGQTVTLTGSFTDPGLAETWTATVDRGAGAGQQPLTVNPTARTFSFPVAYATPGVFNVTVRVTDKDGALGTQTVPVTVTQAPPPGSVFLGSTVNDGNAQRSMVNSLTVSFSTAVTPQPGAFTLSERRGQTIPLTVTNPSGDARTYVLTFSGQGIIGGSLFDGSYTLALAAALLPDVQGNPLSGGNTSVSFHRLFGDSNGDRVVSQAELDAFNAARGRSTQSNYLWYFDFTRNNRIDDNDYWQIVPRFQGRVTL